MTIFLYLPFDPRPMTRPMERLRGGAHRLLLLIIPLYVGCSGRETDHHLQRPSLQGPHEVSEQAFSYTGNIAPAGECAHSGSSLMLVCETLRGGSIRHDPDAGTKVAIKKLEPTQARLKKSGNKMEVSRSWLSAHSGCGQKSGVSLYGREKRQGLNPTTFVQRCCVLVAASDQSPQLQDLVGGCRVLA